MLYFADQREPCLVPASLIQFDEFSLDCDRYELLRSGRPLKLERIPMELLILLANRNGNLVTRQEIIERLWGKDVFLDTEHGINTAIPKIRLVLKDDPEKPRFIQTVTGKGYRFVADLTNCRLSKQLRAHNCRLRYPRFRPTERRAPEKVSPLPCFSFWRLAVLLMSDGDLRAVFQGPRNM